MNTEISPRIAKMLALTVLISVLWAIAHLTLSYVSARQNLASEVNGLQSTYEELARRRVDVERLKSQLSSLMALPSVRRSTLVAHNERDALNQLMEATRQSLEKIKGRLLLLTEDSGNHVQTLVGVEVRARLAENLLPQWLSLVDAGQVRPRVQDLTIAAHYEGTNASEELEISATLTVPWAAAKEQTP